MIEAIFILGLQAIGLYLTVTGVRDRNRKNRRWPGRRR
jgi:hypothetical protein